ncbi:MAG: hypothetical protein ACT4RN_15035 [Pseudonocardia sp.]
MHSGKTRRAHRPWAGARATGLLGVTGSVAGTAAMVVPVIGVAGAGAAASGRDMADMTGPTQGGLIGVLIEYGPIILVVSVVLVTVSVALHRPLGAVPALAAGALLYWGMYAQPSYPVMYLSLALGFAGWAATYIWVRTRGSTAAASST